MTAYNDENFAITNAFQLWTETIQQDNTGFRTHPNLYKTDTLRVHQLDHLKQVIRTVKFFDSFPTAVGAVTLGWGTPGISNAEITMSYDYWRLEYSA